MEMNQERDTNKKVSVVIMHDAQAESTLKFHADNRRGDWKRLVSLDQYSLTWDLQTFEGTNPRCSSQLWYLEEHKWKQI